MDVKNGTTGFHKYELDISIEVFDPSLFVFVSMMMEIKGDSLLIDINDEQMLIYMNPPIKGQLTYPACSLCST